MKKCLLDILIRLDRVVMEFVVSCRCIRRCNLLKHSMTLTIGCLQIWWLCVGYAQQGKNEYDFLIITFFFEVSNNFQTLSNMPNIVDRVIERSSFKSSLINQALKLFSVSGAKIARNSRLLWPPKKVSFYFTSEMCDQCNCIRPSNSVREECVQHRNAARSVKL